MILLFSTFFFFFRRVFLFMQSTTMELPKFPPPEPGVQMRTIETMEEYSVSVSRSFPFLLGGGRVGERAVSPSVEECCTILPKMITIDVVVFSFGPSPSCSASICTHPFSCFEIETWFPVVSEFMLVPQAHLCCSFFCCLLRVLFRRYI